MQSYNRPTEVVLFVAAVSPFAHIPPISRIISSELVDLFCPLSGSLRRLRGSFLVFDVSQQTYDVQFRMSEETGANLEFMFLQRSVTIKLSPL